MKRLLILLTAIPLMAIAQEQLTPKQQMEQANDRMAALARQRDDANNRAALIEAESMRLARELALAREELEKLKPRAPEAKK